MKRLIRVMFLLLIVLVVSFIHSFDTIRGETRNYDLVLSNISVTYIEDTGSLTLTGNGTDVSILDNTEFYEILDEIGRDSIHELFISNLSLGENAPMFNTPNCSSIGFSNISTTNTTSFIDMFRNCKSITTLDLSSFDTTNAVSFDGMFYECSLLQSISGLEAWNTSSCKSFRNMFNLCESLTTLPSLANWDTSACKDMAFMFRYCSSLASIDGLDSWDTGKVITFDSMFSRCKSLQITGVELWNTASCHSFNEMFKDCEVMTGLNLSAWSTNKVTIFSNMFLNCIALTSLDLSNWDTSNAQSLNNMFGNCESLVEIKGLDGFNTSKCLYFDFMFEDCKLLDSLDEVNSWDVSSAIKLEYMFKGCKELDSLDLSSWSVSNVETFACMFYDCDELTTAGDLSNWDVSSAILLDNMFFDCGDITYIGDLSNWEVGSVTDFNSMFLDCKKLVSIGDLSNWNVSSGRYFDNMFHGCNIITSFGDLTNWQVTALTIECMFENCYALESIGDLSNWDVSGADSFDSMFKYCELITSLGDLSNWGTGNSTTFAQMFDGCDALTYIGDLSSWDTSKATSFSKMFRDCSDLENIGNLDNWVTDNVTDMGEMFDDCKRLRTLGDLSSWDVSNVTNFYKTFYGCRKCEGLESVSSWEIVKATTLEGFFYKCYELTYVDMSSWDLSNVTSIANFMTECSSLEKLCNPKAMSDSCSSGMDLPARFYDTVVYGQYTNAYQAPLETWIYIDKEHSISYPNISEDLIIEYNLPTSFWESEGIYLVSIDNIYYIDGIPNEFRTWDSATNKNGVPIPLSKDYYGVSFTGQGVTTDINVMAKWYTYSLLVLKDTMNPSYHEEMYYIPSLPFVNNGQPYSLPELNMYGYTFAGWTGSSSEFIEEDKIENSDVIDFDVIYGHWQINSYKVTIRDKDGDHVFLCVYNTPVMNAINQYLYNYTEPEGYNLASWNTKEDGSGDNISSDYLCLSDLVVYPIYFSDFVVRVPQTLVADKDGNCSFYISSDVELGEVKLTFPNKIYYTQQGKDTVEAVINSSSSILNNSSNRVTCNIVCNKLTAGSWECVFYIDILYNAKKED